MNRFINNMTYAYPNSWYFSFSGFTEAQGLHFHMPVFIDYENDRSFHDLKVFAREKWQDQLFRIDRSDCFDLKPFDMKHFYYITTKKKNWEYLALREQNKSCHLYTMRNKKNMKFYRPTKFKLSGEELMDLQREIERYVALHGIPQNSYSHQFEYWSGRVSFLPRAWLLKTIEKIIHKHRKSLLPT